MILASAYVLLSVIMTLLLFRILMGEKLPPISWKKNGKPLVLIVIWLSYLYILSRTRILENFAFPPRFPLFVFCPLFLFFIGFFVRYRNSASLQSIPLHWTTYFQSYRIFVEGLLYFTFLRHLIPIEATFEGYNFDVFFGVLSIPVGYLLSRKFYPKRLLIRCWNILGILMVLFVGFIIGTSVYQPEIWGFDQAAVSMQFLRYPYLLIPGYLAPMAIFVHVVSLIQLRKK